MTAAIRRYGPANQDAVQALFVRVNRELAPPAMRAAFEDYIALSIRTEIGRIGDYYQPADRAGFWLCHDQDVLVGMFGIERQDDATAELRRMYVAPEARRRGIAHVMLGHAEQFCRKAGYRTLILSTSELQPAAVALYRAADYRLEREEIATTASNKMVGGNLRRYYFKKDLMAPP